MSETPAEASATETEVTEPKPSETVDFWKQKAREQEKRAKDNAEAAKRLAEIEQAQRTAEERAAERVAAAEKRAAELEAKAIRGEVSGETGVPAALLAGPEDGTAESVKAYAAALQAWATDKGTKPQQGLHIVNPGQRPGSEPDKDAMARTFFGV